MAECLKRGAVNSIQPFINGKPNCERHSQGNVLEAGLALSLLELNLVCLSPMFIDSCSGTCSGILSLRMFLFGIKSNFLMHPVDSC